MIQANKHCCAVDFGVGDKVQVIIKHQNNDWPSCKLAQQIEGPYEILEQISYFFKLKLLESIKVYLVFYAEKLCKDLENPFLSQTNPNPLLLEVEEGKEEYEVQEVLAVKHLCEKL